MNYNLKTLSALLQFVVSINFISAQPKAIVIPLTYNFGEIVQDSVVSKSFTFTNEGNEVLKIIEVNASCGCTAAVVGKRELNPGQSTEIKVSFDSNGKTGNQNKTVNVSTNDPNNGNIKLFISGNVIKKDSGTEKLIEESKIIN